VKEKFLIRWFVVIAVLANVGLFLWWRGWLPAQLGEVENRQAGQVAAEKIELVPLEKLKPPVAMATSCIEVGPLEQLLGEKLLSLTDSMGPDIQVTSVALDPEGGFVAYVPWNGDTRAMDRRFAEMKRLGYTDASAVLEGNLRGSVSLGLFPTEAAAKQAAQIAANKSGLEIRVTQLVRQTPRAMYQIRYPAPADGSASPYQSRITGIKIELGVSSAACAG
jgi:hypothetical protein